MSKKIYNNRRGKHRKLRVSAVILFALILCGIVALGVFIAANVFHIKLFGTAPSTASSSSGSPWSSTASASTASYSASASDPLLVLVNKENALPDGYDPKLKTLPSKYFVNTGRNMQFSSVAAPYLEQMIAAAAADGINFSIWSAYRSEAYQEANFKSHVNSYLTLGYSESAAESKTAETVAPPGHSEHQTGLAIDIISATWDDTHSELTDDFDETKEFQWLKQNCATYGFILRYPKDKISITEYEYEPWHYRFVGVDNAKNIMGGGLCLEEYISLLTSK